MNLLIDHFVFQEQTVGGVSKALVEMAKRLPHDIRVDIPIKFSDNVYLRESSLVHLENRTKVKSLNSFFYGLNFPGKSRLYNTLKNYNLFASVENLNFSCFVEKMNEGQYDVLQLSNYDTSFLPYNKKPFVLIIHDLIPELFPQYFKSDFPQIKAREKLVPLASKIIAISENTKKDILSRWQLDENKVEVIYWGSPYIKDISCQYNRFILGTYPYIMYVGGRGLYKRFKFFVKEAIDFLMKNKEVHVVCTGKEFSIDEKLFLLKHNLLDRFHSIFVSTAELYSIYANAICFVFPSEYEGFGLPILEAMACKCPVLLSKRSCFPEIGGDAVLYFEEDTCGNTDISDKLSVLYHMQPLDRNDLIDKGLKRLNLFSWEKCANKYADVYKSLI